jgi:hypothetical protein
MSQALDTVSLPIVPANIAVHNGGKQSYFWSTCFYKGLIVHIALKNIINQN